MSTHTCEQTTCRSIKVTLTKTHQEKKTKLQRCLTRLKLKTCLSKNLRITKTNKILCSTSSSTGKLVIIDSELLWEHGNILQKFNREKIGLLPLREILFIAENSNSFMKAGEESAINGLKNGSIEKRQDSENNLRTKCLLLGRKKLILSSYIWPSLKTKSRLKLRLGRT